MSLLNTECVKSFDPIIIPDCVRRAYRLNWKWETYYSHPSKTNQKKKLPLWLFCSIQNCILNFNCLLTAYGSSREININVYCNLVQEFYTEVLLNIRDPNNKPWIFPSPSLHAFLSHSRELIDTNNYHGLCNFSEQGLENNHKFCRFFRKTLSRKCSQEDNLSDCFSRLWLQSDPIIRKSGRKAIFCGYCKNTTHFTVSYSKKKTLNPVSGPQTWHDITMKQLFV